MIISSPLNIPNCTMYYLVSQHGLHLSNISSFPGLDIPHCHFSIEKQFVPERTWRPSHFPKKRKGACYENSWCPDLVRIPWIASTPPSLETSGQYLDSSHCVRLASAQLAHSWHSIKQDSLMLDQIQIIERDESVHILSRLILQKSSHCHW